MKLSKLIFVFALAASSVYAGGQDQDALNRLKTTKFFAFGGVGYAGQISEGEKDFRTIYSQPPDIARSQFRELLTEGNSEAKSYALVGIRMLQPERFAELSQFLRDASREVTTMSGCLLDHQSPERVVKDIAKGHYDIWLKKR